RDHSGQKVSIDFGLGAGRRGLARFDRRRREGGQHRCGLLVLLVEGATPLLLGQVEIAESPLTPPDGNSQEGPHGRMMRWEAARRRMGREVIESHRTICDEEVSEQTTALWERSDAVDGLVVEPVVDESIDLSGL